jgi:hypothetical protein
MASVSFGDEPRPVHRLVVTAPVQVDVAPDHTVSGQLVDVSIQGAYVALATTNEVRGLVRFTFGLEGSTDVCIAYGSVVRFVNLRDSSGMGIRFSQHNPPFTEWITRVREASPSDQLEALNAMRRPVIRVR